MDEERRVRPGKLLFIDLEFTHVSSAVYDLAYASYLYQMHPGVTAEQEEQRDAPEEMRRAFLEAYLIAMGDPATKEDVDALLIDTALARLTHHFGELSPFKGGIKNMSTYRAAAAKLLASAEEQEQFLQNGGEGRWLNQLHSICLVAAFENSSWYQQMQAALENDPQPPDAACVVPLESSVKGLVPIKPVSDDGLALQVKAGSTRLELAQFDENDPNQRWLWVDDAVQHAASGLFLDGEVKYASLDDLSRAWDFCGSELFVKPRAETDNQRWVFDEGLLRHRVDGRVLDINFWKTQAGQGVNINRAHSSKDGQLFTCPTETSTEPDFSPTTLLPITTVAEGSIVFMCSGKDPAFCLSVRSDGWTKDEHEVFLAKRTGAAVQQWKLVGANRFQHVESGRFLDTEMKYIHTKAPNAPWRGTGTNLVTRPESNSETQKWFLVCSPIW